MTAKTLFRLAVRAMRTRLGQHFLAPNCRFRVQRWTVEAPGWATRPPLRIGILSDTHCGFAGVDTALLARVKARLMALSPDIIVFLGDVSGGWTAEARTANVAPGAAALAGVRAPLGTFAVLGNHDWHDDPAAQSRRGGPVSTAVALETAGFTVLQNRAVRTERSDFWLAGLDSQQAFKGHAGEAKRLGANDMAAMLESVRDNDPVIMLAHEPDIFADLGDERVILTLSGHMHGGQIRPFGQALYAPSRHGTRFAYGSHRIEDRHLIVSGGLGCTRLPLRIGIVPEITLVTLKGP